MSNSKIVIQLPRKFSQSKGLLALHRYRDSSELAFIKITNVFNVHWMQFVWNVLILLFSCFLHKIVQLLKNEIFFFFSRNLIEIHSFFEVLVTDISIIARINVGIYIYIYIYIYASKNFNKFWFYQIPLKSNSLKL